MWATASTTLLYNRVSFAHASLIELQTARIAEQAVKLYDMLRKNETEMRAALTNGSSRDLMIDSFYKSYFDLRNTDEKQLSIVRLSLQLANEAAIPSRFADALSRFAEIAFSFGRQGAGSTQDKMAEDAQAKTKALIAAREASYRLSGKSDGPPVPASDNDTVVAAFNVFLGNARGFNSAAGLHSVDLASPIPLFDSIVQLRYVLDGLGLWYLPALYGMLGAIIFHMRRFLDPNIPTPSWIRSTYRIFLGAFAGIIVVWFWVPAPQKGSEQAFSTLSSFGVAFLVGFSIDIFFQVMDRLVTYVGQAIGKPA
jgi:hypothetical protein